MINFSEAFFDKISIHSIGSKVEHEGVKFSETETEISDETLRNLMLQYFFHSFKTPEYYAFDFSNGDLSLNAVHEFVDKIFNGEEVFEISNSIAKHLYDKSNHPNIKPGELMICHVQDLLIDDEMLDAVVIVKSESKDDFLKIISKNQSFDIERDQGIFAGKLDKACIVFNTEKESGYKLCIIDKTSSQSDAVFWKEDFLNVINRSDDFHKTKDFIHATKTFIKDRLNPIYEMDKTDEAAILNRSKAFFNQEEDFNAENYAQEVFQDEKVTALFAEYKDDLRQEKNVELPDNFAVSPAAVKNYSKVFKSVIKLDKNFHIYVHGDRNLIEKGNEDGRKFYKIYYDEEK